MSIELEIGANTNDPLTLDEADIESINPVKTHTGVGDVSARIAGNRDVEEYAKRQDRINIKSDGTTFFSGYLLKVSHSKQRGTTRLQGRGIGKKLQETRPDYDSLGGSLTYTNIALEDALEDYWTRTPFNANVTDQSTQIVERDATVVDKSTTSELQQIFSASATDPIRIDNGEISVSQTAFVEEGEVSGGDTVSDVNYSGGDAGAIIDATSTSLNFSFTTLYDVSQSTASIYLRGEGGSGSGSQATADLFFDGNKIRNDTVLVSGSLGWTEIDLSSDLSSDVSSGTHTIKIEFSNAFDNVAQIFDLIAFVDTSYTKDISNLDNTVHQNNGYLDDPKLYPSDVFATSITSDFVTASLDIAEATVDAGYDDTSNDQSLGLDFGSGFDTASNTDTHTATNNSGGRQVRTRLRLSRYPADGTNPQSATPRFGYNSQTVSSVKITADLSDLAVIDELELSKNHFDNLQTLHDYADFIFVIEHDDDDISNLTVNSFQRGDETRTLPSLTTNDINKTPKIDSTQYYNTIYLQGALVSGSRPTAEVKDNNAISNDGREISPGVLRDLDVVTSAGATNRANALLNKAQKNSALRGQKITPAVDISPGYSYPVDFGDGLTEFTAEEVSISKGTDRAETTLDFIPRSDISEDIRELRRNARKTEDQV